MHIPVSLPFISFLPPLSFLAVYTLCLQWYPVTFPTLVDSLLVSVQFSCSVMSDSLQPHGLQHARLPSLSPTPRTCSSSHPSSRWCHPTIASSVVPFLCPQSFPASGSFPMSQLYIIIIYYYIMVQYNTKLILWRRAQRDSSLKSLDIREIFSK